MQLLHLLFPAITIIVGLSAPPKNASLERLPSTFPFQKTSAFWGKAEVDSWRSPPRKMAALSVNHQATCFYDNDFSPEVKPNIFLSWPLRLWTKCSPPFLWAEVNMWFPSTLMCSVCSITYILRIGHGVQPIRIYCCHTVLLFFFFLIWVKCDSVLKHICHFTTILAFWNCLVTRLFFC